MTAIASPRPLTRSDSLFLSALAGIKLLIHLPVLHRYGYHHDELYFLACGRHLALGYVDHPPLVPWIARLADELFAGSLVGLRIFPLLAGVATVFLTGLLTRRLGGGHFAQLVACLAMMVAPVYVRTTNMLHLPVFDVLFWTLAVYLVVRLIQDENPKLWLGVGLVAGIGLMNKHTMLLFGLGLTVGLALTPLRRHFKSPWLYAGGAVAGLIFLPNLLWQVANDWPTVEFLRQHNATTMSEISASQFIFGQVFYLNPVTAPLWIAGLVFFFSAEGQRYRVFGWFYTAIFVLLVVIKSKIYYLAPAYPVLLAGGALSFERWALAWRNRSGQTWLKPALVGGLLFGGMIMAPVSLPYFSLERTERYLTAMTFGAFDNVYEMTGDLRGMFAWQQRAEIVADVYHGLDAGQRATTAIIASWYGTAAAVDFFGRERGLPNAVSTHMNYHLWGPPEESIETILAVDIDRQDLDQYFAEVTVAADVLLENVNPWERRFVVSICRRPKVDLRRAWPEIGRY